MTTTIQKIEELKDALERLLDIVDNHPMIEEMNEEEFREIREVLK